jgi:MFS family permease
MLVVASRLLPALALRRTLDFSPQVRRALRVDISASLLVTVFVGLTGPFTGLILRRELGATPLQLSILASAGAACLLMSLALTRLIDHRRPLGFVVWPTFVARSLFLFVPLIDTPWPLVAVLVTGTLMSAVTGPAQAALVQQVYPLQERGRALGTVRVAGAALSIALSIAAGHLFTWVSYRWIFCAAGVFGMAACLRQRRLPVPPAPAGRDTDRPGLREAWCAMREDHGYRRALLASFVFGSGIWVQMPATPLLLADVLHATTAQVGFLAATAAAAALGGSLLWGHLADRRSSLIALRTVYVLGTLTPLIYYSCRTPWMLVAASISESLMHTGLDLVWMLTVIEFAGPRRTAQYAAIAGTLAGVRGVIGPFLGAAIIETLGVRPVYLVSAGLMATGALMVSGHLYSRRRAAEATARRALEALQAAARI